MLPRSSARSWIGALLLAMSLGSAAANPAAPAQAAVLPVSGPHAGEIVLGRVSDNPKVDYQKLRPLLDYVVPRLADVGITRGRVLMARDNQQMISYLRRGKVDWVTETPGAAMAYQERGGARLLLAAERGGTHAYQSVIFARRDAGITSLADLRGRRIAFQSTASTSAYFLPASEILHRGLAMAILASPADDPGPAVVGFLFARTELNISTWVHKGLVDAGAFSDQDWRDLSRLPQAYRDDLVVVHRTAFVPRALELVRAGLDARVEARLREVLVAAAEDASAAEALRAYFRTTAFTELSGPMQQSLASLRDGVSRIHAEVE